jgi:hypothetical protein
MTVIIGRAWVRSISSVCWRRSLAETQGKPNKKQFRTGVIFRINNQPLAVEIGLNLRDPLAPEAAARLEDA